MNKVRNMKKENIDYKFNEAELIQEFKDYIDGTYTGHYSKDKFQATEFIIDGVPVTFVSKVGMAC